MAVLIGYGRSMSASITARLGTVGAAHYPGAIEPWLAGIEAALSVLPVEPAGTRIHGIEPLREMLAPTGCIGSLAASELGGNARAVRAILFNKSPGSNWSLGWHQDRTICVAERHETPGFGPWTMKQGLHHVAPPFDLLSRMVTLRMHLDDVPADNAPLLIAPGSHRMGRIAVDRIDAVVRHCGTMACLARAGDIWIYSTPILHASGSAVVPGNRRVLQVDYAAQDLPGDLEWLGV